MSSEGEEEMVDENNDNYSDVTMTAQFLWPTEANLVDIPRTLEKMGNNNREATIRCQYSVTHCEVLF